MVQTQGQESPPVITDMRKTNKQTNKLSSQRMPQSENHPSLLSSTLYIVCQPGFSWCYNYLFFIPHLSPKICFTLVYFSYFSLTLEGIYSWLLPAYKFQKAILWSLSICTSLWSKETREPGNLCFLLDHIFTIPNPGVGQWEP